MAHYIRISKYIPRQHPSIQEISHPIRNQQLSIERHHTTHNPDPLSSILNPQSHDSLTSSVQARYGKIARSVSDGGKDACCGPTECGCGDPISGNLYDASQTAGLPEYTVVASLGCGNPTALATLNAGDVVLDLGSGGGIDVLLSAKRAGPTGRAYGLDMTDDMLALARENQRKAGATNVEFLKGHIEHIPLPDNSVDVIISNCVINLSGDKDKVLAEAFRVLKPGGRFAVSDVVSRRRDVPDEIRRSVELWIDCVAGALHEDDFKAKLATAGFENIDIEIVREYRASDARQFLSDAGLDADTIAPLVDSAFGSAFVRASKPK